MQNSINDKQENKISEEKPSNPNKQKEEALALDDIFSETENSELQPEIKKAEVKEAEVNKPAKPKVFQPKEKKKDEAEDGFSVEPAEDAIPKLKRKASKLKIALIFLVLILALSGSSWVAYYYAYPRLKDSQYKDTIKSLINKIGVGVKEGLGTIDPDFNSSEEKDLPENEADTDQDGVSDKEEEANGMNINSNDTDGDGLFDREELKVYKTNPLKADTDGDGLSDWEEIEIYKTNPLKADTDGDGFSDGDEVKAGYNPKGAGKLYDIE